MFLALDAALYAYPKTPAVPKPAPVPATAVTGFSDMNVEAWLPKLDMPFQTVLKPSVNMFVSCAVAKGMRANAPNDNKENRSSFCLFIISTSQLMVKLFNRVLFITVCRANTACLFLIFGAVPIFLSRTGLTQPRFVYRVPR
jgi:hypothetical protein